MSEKMDSPYTPDVPSLRDKYSLQLRSAVRAAAEASIAEQELVWWKPAAVTLRLRRSSIQLRHLLLRCPQ